MPIARPTRVRTTPWKLRATLACGWLLSALLGAVVVSAWAQRRHVVQTLGVDAAPSVEAARKIKIYIESLDADLVNELLDPPGGAAEHTTDFDKNRVDIGTQIIAAARNITYGDAELVPIQKIEDNLGRFLMAAEDARRFHAVADRAAMLRAYRESHHILEQALLPAADDLDAANDSVLQATYAAQRSASSWMLAAMVAVGAALVLMLLWTQRFLVRTFRRLVNPALALATLVVVGFVGGAAQRLSANSRDVKGVKEDSYDSVAALIAARADAYEANAAESRWLLDPERRDEHARAFAIYVGKLVTFADGQSFAKANAIAAERNALMADRMKHGDDPVTAGRIARTRLPFDGIQGRMKDALDNITFPDADPTRDEPTQSAETLRTFGVYVDLDAHIRQLELDGRHADAVAFCLGMKEGESNWAFFQLDAALGRWLALNENWMHRYVDAAFADVAGLEVAAPVVSVLVAILIFVGLGPRIREYLA